MADVLRLTVLWFKSLSHRLIDEESQELDFELNRSKGALDFFLDHSTEESMVWHLACLTSINDDRIIRKIGNTRKNRRVSTRLHKRRAVAAI